MGFHLAKRPWSLPVNVLLTPDLGSLVKIFYGGSPRCSCAIRFREAVSLIEIAKVGLASGEQHSQQPATSGWMAANFCDLTPLRLMRTRIQSDHVNLPQWFAVAVPIAHIRQAGHKFPLCFAEIEFL